MSLILPLVSSSLLAIIGRIFSAVRPPCAAKRRSSPRVMLKPSARYPKSSTLFSDTDRNSSPRRAPELIPCINCRVELAASEADVPEITNELATTWVTAAISSWLVFRFFEAIVRREKRIPTASMSLRLSLAILLISIMPCATSSLVSNVAPILFLRLVMVSAASTIWFAPNPAASVMPI